MRLSKLISRSLVFNRRTNLSIAAGVAVTAAVLVGALVVGDSVRYSLRAITEVRLGTAELALVSADRFFTEQLAGRLAESLDADTAALFLLEGVASTASGARTAAGVQVVGVDESFWSFAPSPASIVLAGDAAVINRELAERLAVGPGDEVILRIGKLSLLPIEAPFAPSTSQTTAIRARVRALARPQDFGSFSLKANHITPPTVFVPLARISRLMEMPGLANVILAARPDKPLKVEEAAAALRDAWRPADASIEFQELPSGTIELRSRRVFIDRAVAAAAHEADPSAGGILSYFVNELAANGRSTPYSLVSAPGAPIVPAGMRDDEIVINEWLAEDLEAAPGDKLTLKHYVVTGTGSLVEESSSFTVREVVPIAGAAADRTLMPDFPGVAKADSTGDWDPGVPVDFSRIRPKDEAYWQTYRGTPKAFVTLNAGKLMWANRFGELTAMRFYGMGSTDAVSAALVARLEPASQGVAWANVRAEGLKAAVSGVDFGDLFLGLSFFIVVAALLLTALLFTLCADARAEETWVMAAFGFRGRTIRRLVLAEATLVALIGAAVGSPAALLYDKAILYALSTIWRGAVMTSALEVAVLWGTLFAGGAAAAAVAIIAIWIALVTRGGMSPAHPMTAAPGGERIAEGRPVASVVVGAVSLAAALGLVALVDPAHSRGATGAFFAGGGLLLVSGAAFFNALFARLAPAGSTRLTLASMGLQNIARHRLRSLAIVVMLACGVFLVVAVGANRRGGGDADGRASGTGGFRFYMETTIPLLDDLNDPEVRRSYGFTGDLWRDVAFVGMRLREGDDASCFNLNRTSRPRILGVDPRALAERHAFTFTDTALEADAASPWLLLDARPAENVIPAVADETVIIWGLGKEVGGALEYVDEGGESFRAKLVGGIANSILQGNIVIAEDAFVARYRSISGRRVFLVDAPAHSAPEVRAALERTLSDFGVTVTVAAERLAAFNTVENTYLSIFLALGGLGLALGSVGMGVVVVRNVLERRSELALLRAVGLSRGALLKLLLWEHWLLLGAGLLTGAVSAGVAVVPAVLSPGTSIPWATIALVVFGVAASGAVWVWIATRLAIRGDLLAALRKE